MRRLLVLTTVHHADDTRIREKLIRTLDGGWQIDYRTRPPAPASDDGMFWRPLRGSRLVRNLAAASLLKFSRHDAVVIHDPELLPAALAASLIRRRPVVFDVHEDIPAQIMTKPQLPLRRSLAAIAALLLRWAERRLVVTLAEPGYQRLFRQQHPVFANYPDPARLPPPAADGGYAVYVGDVTELRGVPLAVRACVRAGLPLIVVGRCSPDLADRLRAEATAAGGSVDVRGRLPHRAALDVMRSARVGLSPLQDIPNYRHSLPTKVLEYLGVGIPVIASDLPGTAAVIGDHPAVRLLTPDDEDAWVDALRAVSDDDRAAARTVEVGAGWPAAGVRDFYDSLG